MFILAPVWHKSERWPAATALLVLSNVLIFAVFWPVELKQAALVSRDEIVQSAQKLSQVLLQKDSGLPQARKDEIAAEQNLPSFPSENLIRTFREIHADPYALSGESRYKWDLHYAAFEPMLKANQKDPGRKTFYHRWGFRPKDSPWPGILTHQFLHAGFLHLFFNMLFLWAAGCVLEARMGWKFLPFYFLGGIAGALAQAQFSTSSFDTMVGASGAISAMLGFSLIGFPTATVTLFYLLILGISPRTGFFDAPLWFFVPLWLFDQLWMAMLTSGMAFVNVGFAAHLGGFGFGAVCALVFVRRVT